MAKKKHTYDFPMPAVTTDAIIFSFDSNQLQVLLIRRKEEPFKNKWAFPGGFINPDETAEECVLRELEEETGLNNVEVQQFGSFTDPKRDPRGRTITIAFFG